MPAAPQEQLPEPTAPLVARAHALRATGSARAGLAFIVVQGGQHFAIITAHAFDPTAPAIDVIELRDPRASESAAPLARIDAVWGLAGDAGADIPVLDLRSDRVVARLSTPPAGFGALRLDTRTGPEVGERVWLASPDATAVMGYVPLAGTVTDADAGFVEVRMDAPLEPEGLGGGPVVALEGGAVVGMLSRAARMGEHLALWLTPAAALRAAIEGAVGEVELPNAIASGRVPPGGPTRLAFAWPERLQARVTRERLRRDGGADATERSAASFTMEVQRDAEGYRIAYADFELPSGADADGAAKLSSIANLGPSYRVSTDGQFGAVVDLDRLLGALDGMLEGIPEEQRTLLRERFVNAEVLTRMAESDWNQRVASWVGAELDAGETYQLDAEVAMPLFGSDTVPTKSYFQLTRDVPCDAQDEARGCVRIDMLTMPDRAKMRQLLHRFVERMAPRQPGAAPPELEGFQLRSRMQLVTDPDTLLPHRVREEKSTRFRVAGAGGGELESYEVKEERYEY